MKIATEKLIDTILAQLLCWTRVKTRARQGNCTHDKECHFGLCVERYEEIALRSEISLQIKCEKHEKKKWINTEEETDKLREKEKGQKLRKIEKDICKTKMAFTIVCCLLFRQFKW